MSEKQKAYESFKLQWMIDHGYTLEDLMNAMEDLKREAPFVDLRMIFDHAVLNALNGDSCGNHSEAVAMAVEALSIVSGMENDHGQKNSDVIDKSAKGPNWDG